MYMFSCLIKRTRAATVLVFTKTCFRCKKQGENGPFRQTMTPHTIFVATDTVLQAAATTIVLVLLLLYHNFYNY